MSELATLLSKLSPTELEATLREAELLKADNVWPKHVNLSLHRDKDSNYDVAQDLGLSLEAQDAFRHTGYEVILTAEIHEDGTAYATTIRCGEQRLELSPSLRI